MTIETEENIVQRVGEAQRNFLRWCPACRRQVEMVTPEQAAQIAGVSTRTIYRWIEGGTVHLIEDCGDTLVCISLLSRRAAGLRFHPKERA